MRDQFMKYEGMKTFYQETWGKMQLIKAKEQAKEFIPILIRKKKNSILIALLACVGGLSLTLMISELNESSKLVLNARCKSNVR